MLSPIPLSPSGLIFTYGGSCGSDHTTFLRLPTTQRLILTMFVYLPISRSLIAIAPAALRYWPAHLHRFRQRPALPKRDSRRTLHLPHPPRQTRTYHNQLTYST